MDQQLNDRLTKIEQTLAENNRIIKKVRQSQKNAAFFRIGYWVLIILMGLGTFYFIKPFLGQFGEAYGLGDNPTYNSLLEQLKGYQTTTQ